MEFWHAIEWFIYGAIAGWFANPFWRLLTKIVNEATIAKQEWRNPLPPTKRTRDEHAP